MIGLSYCYFDKINHSTFHQKALVASTILKTCWHSHYKQLPLIKPDLSAEEKLNVFCILLWFSLTILGFLWKVFRLTVLPTCKNPAVFQVSSHISYRTNLSSRHQVNNTDGLLSPSSKALFLAIPQSANRFYGMWYPQLAVCKRILLYPRLILPTHTFLNLNNTTLIRQLNTYLLVLQDSNMLIFRQWHILIMICKTFRFRLACQWLINGKDCLCWNHFVLNNGKNLKLKFSFLLHIKSDHR